MEMKPLHRHALLVGISRYRHPRVSSSPGVDKDLAILARQLSEPSLTPYDSITVARGREGELTGQELREALESFLKEPPASAYLASTWSTSVVTAWSTWWGRCNWCLRTFSRSTRRRPACRSASSDPVCRTISASRR